LAGTLWLWRSDRRRAGAFAATIGLTALAVLALMNSLTNGGFYQSIVVANLGQYDVGRALLFLLLFVVLWPVAVAVAALEIIHAVKGSGAPLGAGGASGADAPFLVWGMVPYTLGSLISAATVGKLGSDINYLLELSAALALWTGIAVGRRRRRPAAVTPALLLLVLCQMVWMVIASQPIRSNAAGRWGRIADYDRLFGYVESAVAEGTVLADARILMVALAGQRVYIEPFMVQQLYAAGRWDPSDLIADIEAHKFPMILVSSPDGILTNRGWSEPVRSAIDENYQVQELVIDVCVYVPRGSAS
jgi:hypothetical protein